MACGYCLGSAELEKETERKSTLGSHGGEMRPRAGPSIGNIIGTTYFILNVLAATLKKG